MRWNHYVYALILIGMAVGWFYFPRTSWLHVVITAVGLGAILLVGRLAGRPWGKV